MIGRHEAATHQLLSVVTGEGWVSGPDGNRIPIAVGRAAFWGRGEEHETGTDTGLTAIVLEGPGPLGVVSAGNMTALSGCPQSERDMINGWVG